MVIGWQNSKTRETERLRPKNSERLNLMGTDWRSRKTMVKLRRFPRKMAKLSRRGTVRRWH